jgi:hypothetical protein
MKEGSDFQAPILAEGVNELASEKESTFDEQVTKLKSEIERLDTMIANAKSELQSIDAIFPGGIARDEATRNMRSAIKNRENDRATLAKNLEVILSEKEVVAHKLFSGKLPPNLPLQ